jgi:hypothetical protein
VTRNPQGMVKVYEMPHGNVNLWDGHGAPKRAYLAATLASKFTFLGDRTLASVRGIQLASLALFPHHYH